MNGDALELLCADETLRPLIDEHGPVSIEPAERPFERLVVSIINQQLSTASAAAIKARVFDTVDITPEALVSEDPARLQSAGLSAQKAAYIQNAADAFLTNGYSYDYFGDMDDDAVLDELTAIRGIGTWTGKMFLISCLAREDVFPVEDLGIRAGMQTLYGNDLDVDDMIDIADRWRPYRSYASRYLWRAVD